jgi:hypothetical protein
MGVVIFDCCRDDPPGGDNVDARRPIVKRESKLKTAEETKEPQKQKAAMAKVDPNP